jgi:hypothetical protein
MKTLSVAIVCVCFVSLTASCKDPPGADARADGPVGTDVGSDTLNPPGADARADGPVGTDVGSDTLDASDSAPPDVAVDTPTVEDAPPTPKDDGVSLGCKGDQEPNDTPNLACTVAIGSLVQGRVEQGTTDVADCFRFDVEANVDYTLSVRVIQSTADNLYPRLYFNVASESGSVLLTDQHLLANQAGDYGFTPIQSGVARLCLAPQNPQALFVYNFRIDKPFLTVGLFSTAMHSPSTVKPGTCPSQIGTFLSS